MNIALHYSTLAQNVNVKLYSLSACTVLVLTLSILRLPMPVNVTMAPTDDDLDDVYEDSMKKTNEYHRDR